MIGTLHYRSYLQERLSGSFPDKYPLFCPEAFLKEKGFYINTSTEVKFIKIRPKLSNNNLKMLQ